MSVVALAGASGFLGEELASRLEERGDRVLRLVRREPRGPDEIRWDPGTGELDPGALDGVDAVVNLCGENIASKRWTFARRVALRSSRVDPAHLLAAACVRAGVPTLVNASATGIYGDRGEEILDERSASGGGFLADLAVAWEHALRPAEDAGARVVRMRLGVVLDMAGGALPPLAVLHRLCLGGRVGSGRQWFPWIAREDAVRAFVHVLDHRLVSGPVVVVSPEACRQLDFTRALARRLRRPSPFPLPAFAVSFLMGERGRELLLQSQRCRPSVLTDSGFAWRLPSIGTALEELL